MQNEKDEELSTLSEDVTKLKRELDTRREEIEKYKRMIDARGSIDNISMTSEEIDDDTRGRWTSYPLDVMWLMVCSRRSSGKLGADSHAKYSTRRLETTICRDRQEQTLALQFRERSTSRPVHRYRVSGELLVRLVYAILRCS